mmetsp:Transcript_58606/g.162092  ORF Transcript_58606/g.162092 Transcript_58606/m.162092 type:complete len:204 (+) Transcript_58606:546-1157(+)
MPKSSSSFSTSSAYSGSVSVIACASAARSCIRWNFGLDTCLLQECVGQLRRLTLASVIMAEPRSVTAAAIPSPDGCPRSVGVGTMSNLRALDARLTATLGTEGRALASTANDAGAARLFPRWYPATPEIQPCIKPATAMAATRKRLPCRGGTGNRTAPGGLHICTRRECWDTLTYYRLAVEAQVWEKPSGHHARGAVKKTMHL